jgi:hypothetical protein
LVGVLAAEADAKFRWGSVLLQGARLAKNRELSRRGVIARQAETADRDQAIVDASRTYRAKHPLHSTRTMSAWIARHLDLAVGTVRDRLRKCGIR